VDAKKCEQANFLPKDGQIPRGFVGATGTLEQVEAIFVSAEPGHPQSFEKYENSATSGGLLMEAIKTAYHCFSERKDIFHKNTCRFLDKMWPNQSFDEHLEKVWITNGRLCSIQNEIGSFNDRICAPLYLKQQILLLPKAIIITFGGKARKRVEQIKGLDGRIILNAWSLAPPGANTPAAKDSWERVIDEFKKLKGNSNQMMNF